VIKPTTSEENYLYSNLRLVKGQKQGPFMPFRDLSTPTLHTIYM